MKKMITFIGTAFLFGSIISCDGFSEEHRENLPSSSTSSPNTEALKIPISEISPPNQSPKAIIYAVAPQGGSEEPEKLDPNNELVILYNLQNSDLDISGWKIKYSGQDNKTPKTKFTIPKNQTLCGKQYLLIAGKDYNMGKWEGDTTPDLTSDSNFIFSATSGHILLLDNQEQEQDRIGYGKAVNPEEEAAEYPKGSCLLYRKDPDIDTNNNKTDFTTAETAISPTLKNSSSK